MQDFLDEEFDTEKEECSQAFALLPAGRYTAEIVSAKAGPTKNGKGYAVNLNWSITEGEHENRTLFQSILIQHESAEAMKFGRQKFADVLAALGIKGKVSDLNTLLNKPCSIGVKTVSDKSGQYPDKNEIGRVMPLVKPYTPPFKKDDPISTGPITTKGANGLNDRIPF